MPVIFVDTGAWFAHLVPSDPDHRSARDWFDQNTLPLVTTDYVVDELLTLLKMRGEYLRALESGSLLLHGEVCDLEWVSRTDVESAWVVFSTFRDKQWSFTDCVSKVVMERLRIDTAISFDVHFRQFGTVSVVP
jgi:predicted nucleic acid-binding protein